MERIIFNQDLSSTLSSGCYLRWFLCTFAGVIQCTIGWILTDLAHKYLWCCDILWRSKQLPHAVNCVDFDCSQQNRKPLRGGGKHISQLFDLIKYNTCFSELPYLIVFNATCMVFAITLFNYNVSHWRPSFQTNQLFYPFMAVAIDQT